MKKIILIIGLLLQLNLFSSEGGAAAVVPQDPPGGRVLHQAERERKEFAADPISLLRDIQLNNIASISNYLKSGSNPDIYINGYTLLMWAILFQRIEMINELITYGANPSLKDQIANKTALEIAESLKQPLPKQRVRGENPNKTIEEIIAILNIKPNNPEFAKKGILLKNIGMLTAYLDNGGDPNAFVEEEPLLHIAVNFPEGFKLLISRGAKIDLRTKDNWPILYSATKNATADVVNLLLNKYRDKIDIDELNPNKVLNVTALARAGYDFLTGGMFGREFQNPQNIISLLNAGADPTKRGVYSFCDVLKIENIKSGGKSADHHVPKNLPKLKEIWQKYKVANQIQKDPCEAQERIIVT